jgi:cytochrome P450
VRRCLGAAFAEFEMRVVLTEMLRRRTLQSETGRAEHLTRRNVTFSPKTGTRVITRRRRVASQSRTSVQDQSRVAV